MRTRTLVAVWLAGILGICARGWAAEPRFRLTVLAQEMTDLKAQTWEEAWPLLREAPGPPFFTLDERDVAAYDWQAQRIVLRPEVNQRLLEAAQKLPWVPERLGRLKALWSEDDLFHIFSYRGFVVSLDGEPLYGGFFLSEDSSLAMWGPVIHWTLDDDRRIVLRFFPVQSSFEHLWDDKGGDTDPEVREQRQAFRPWEEVESFKRRIQDPRVRAVFTALKTPAQAPPLRVERPAPAQPVRISARPYSRDYPSKTPKEGWLLSLGWPGTVSEVRYRRSWKGEGARWEVSTLGLSSLGDLPPGRYRIDLEALDWAGEVVGRYVFWFDPEQEALFSAKMSMETTEWVSFSDSEKGDRSWLYFLGLDSVFYRGLLREIRYSLDDCSLDRRFPVSFQDKLSEEVSASSAFACVQVVYSDGEATAPRRFYHHESRPGPAPSEPVAASAVLQPVSVKVWRRDYGLTLYLELEEEFSAREIHYRFGSDSEWRPARPGEAIDLITGRRFPSQMVWLPPGEVRPGRQRMEVKLTGWNGVESGPYTLWFDPEAKIPAESEAPDPSSSGESGKTEPPSGG